MPRKPIASELNPWDIYPDPLGRAKGAALIHPIADLTPTEGVPLSLSFPELPAAIEQDVLPKARQEQGGDQPPRSNESHQPR